MRFALLIFTAFLFIASARAEKIDCRNPQSVDEIYFCLICGLYYPNAGGVTINPADLFNRQGQDIIDRDCGNGANAVKCGLLNQAGQIILGGAVGGAEAATAVADFAEGEQQAQPAPNADPNNLLKTIIVAPPDFPWYLCDPNNTTGTSTGTVTGTSSSTGLVGTSSSTKTSSSTSTGSTTTSSSTGSSSSTGKPGTSSTSTGGTTSSGTSGSGTSSGTASSTSGSGTSSGTSSSGTSGSGTSGTSGSSTSGTSGSSSSTSGTSTSTGGSPGGGVGKPLPTGPDKDGNFWTAVGLNFAIRLPHNALEDAPYDVDMATISKGTIEVKAKLPSSFKGTPYFVGPEQHIVPPRPSSFFHLSLDAKVLGSRAATLLDYKISMDPEKTPGNFAAVWVPNDGLAASCGNQPAAWNNVYCWFVRGVYYPVVEYGDVFGGVTFPYNNLPINFYWEKMGLNFDATDGMAYPVGTQVSFRFVPNPELEGTLVLSDIRGTDKPFDPKNPGDWQTVTLKQASSGDFHAKLDCKNYSATPPAYIEFCNYISAVLSQQIVDLYFDFPSSAGIAEDPIALNATGYFYDWFSTPPSKEYETLSLEASYEPEDEEYGSSYTKPLYRSPAPVTYAQALDKCNSLGNGNYRMLSANEATLYTDVLVGDVFRNEVGAMTNNTNFCVHTGTEVSDPSTLRRGYKYFAWRYPKVTDDYLVVEIPENPCYALCVASPYESEGSTTRETLVVEIDRALDEAPELGEKAKVDSDNTILMSGNIFGKLLEKLNPDLTEFNSVSLPSYVYNGFADLQKSDPTSPGLARFLLNNNLVYQLRFFDGMPVLAQGFTVENRDNIFAMNPLMFALIWPKEFIARMANPDTVGINKLHAMALMLLTPRYDGYFPLQLSARKDARGPNDRTLNELLEQIFNPGYVPYTFEKFKRMRYTNYIAKGQLDNCPTSIDKYDLPPDDPNAKAMAYFAIAYCYARPVVQVAGVLSSLFTGPLGLSIIAAAFSGAEIVQTLRSGQNEFGDRISGWGRAGYAGLLALDLLGGGFDAYMRSAKMARLGGIKRQQQAIDEFHTLINTTTGAKMTKVEIEALKASAAEAFQVLGARVPSSASKGLVAHTKYREPLTLARKLDTFPAAAENIYIPSRAAAENGVNYLERVSRNLEKQGLTGIQQGTLVRPGRDPEQILILPFDSDASATHSMLKYVHQKRGSVTFISAEGNYTHFSNADYKVLDASGNVLLESKQLGNTGHVVLRSEDLVKLEQLEGPSHNLTDFLYRNALTVHELSHAETQALKDVHAVTSRSAYFYNTEMPGDTYKSFQFDEVMARYSEMKKIVPNIVWGQERLGLFPGDFKIDFTSIGKQLKSTFIYLAHFELSSLKKLQEVPISLDLKTLVTRYLDVALSKKDIAARAIARTIPETVEKGITEISATLLREMDDGARAGKLPAWYQELNNCARGGDDALTELRIIKKTGNVQEDIFTFQGTNLSAELKNAGGGGSATVDFLALTGSTNREFYAIEVAKVQSAIAALLRMHFSVNVAQRYGSLGRDLVLKSTLNRSQLRRLYSIVGSAHTATRGL